MARQDGCCNGSRQTRRRGNGCCDGSRKSIDRTAKHCDTSGLSQQLTLLKAAQCAALAIYFIVSLASARQGQPWILFLTSITLILTATSASACGFNGYKSKGFLVFSITADSVCIVLQLATIIGLFATGSFARCFAGETDGGSYGRRYPRCGVTGFALFLSIILLVAFIHSLVRAAILISVGKCRSGQGSSDPAPGEDLPAYPALDRDIPLYPVPDASTQNVDDRNNPKGADKDMSSTPSATLADVVVTSESPNGSDAGDCYRENRPLLPV